MTDTLQMLSDMALKDAALVELNQRITELEEDNKVLERAASAAGRKADMYANDFKVQYGLTTKAIQALSKLSLDMEAPDFDDKVAALVCRLAIEPDQKVLPKSIAIAMLEAEIAKLRLLLEWAQKKPSGSIPDGPPSEEKNVREPLPKMRWGHYED